MLMHNCGFCRNPVRPLTEWKGTDGRFYCSEFCADAGDSSMGCVMSPREKIAVTGAQAVS
jgi:hypothetical protein